ncbi:hypothetical protein DUNSADRAFT_9462 [Dunaliella salina]|uniref:Homeobox domain-containing protein n=1 Tax=Dunaliella salina TaxID=3046 RepID=A0ABQ7GHE0_DUNSA|nr:hypothetical protein DUNSADRAFT_9462 [Dunaliella salina]|eukprot:KAF5834023.1 hypothetical protein DUNSADRAFT_9462 [Dunaliella salina]
MHIMDPRPDGTLKDNLAAYTRRTRKQVTDWFTNWRARHWKTVVRGIGVSLDQSDASGNDGAPHAASEEE